MTALFYWLSNLGPTNPMVRRIVYGGSRRVRDFLIRVGYLGVLVGLVVFTMLTGGAMGGSVSMSELAKAGSAVFAVIAYGQVIGVCLLAPLFMAGAIASEQSGKTYDILLTTPMSNLQVVLGSLLGRLFFVLTLLASGLPLFAVLLVFGGVRGGAVVEAFLVAACTAVLVGAVAVTLSVLRAGGRKAVFAFVIGIAGLLVAGYALDVLLLRALDPSPYTTWLTPLHPLLVLESSIRTVSYGPPPAEVVSAWLGEAAVLRGVRGWWLAQPFEAFVTWTLGLSVVLLVGCSLFVRRLGQGAGALPGWLLWVLRLNPGERMRAHRLVSGNPIAWREANTRGQVASGILARWGFVALAWGGAAWLLWGFHRGTLPELPTSTGGSRGAVAAQVETLHALLSVLLLLEVAVIVLVAIYMSAGCVSREREDGTLDIMLTTPVTPKQYIWGKLRGLVRFLALLIAAPVGTLLLVGGYMALGWYGGAWDGTYAFAWNAAPGGVSSYGGGPSGGGAMVTDAWVVLPEAGLLLGLMLVPFLALCVMAGMTWSLKAKTVIGAVVPTVLLLGGLAAVLGLCGLASAAKMSVVGPVLNALSPATSVPMLLDPYGQAAGFASDPLVGRVALWSGGVLAAVVYGMIVYGLIAMRVKDFDQTVRKLSGTG